MCHPIETFQRTDDIPAVTAELVERICHERTHLETLLKNWPADQRLAPLPGGGWTIGEHLQHLTAWRRVLLGWLQGRLKGVQILPEDAIPLRQNPPAAVLDDFRAVHLDTLAEIASLPTEALTRPSGVNDLTMGELIAACTWAHDRRHREALSTDEHGLNGFSLV